MKNNNLSFVHTTKRQRRAKIFVGSLAVVLSCVMMGGVFGVAPKLSNSASVAEVAHSTDVATIEEALHPETDPYVVTENGLQIHYSNLTVGGCSWAYLTVGSYKWIIVGYNNIAESFSFSSYQNPTNSVFQSYAHDYYSDNRTITVQHYLDVTGSNSTIKETSSPAGQAINNGGTFSKDMMGYWRKANFPNAVQNTSEIPSGCVLCTMVTPYKSTSYSSKNAGALYCVESLSESSFGLSAISSKLKTVSFSYGHTISGVYSSGAGWTKFVTDEVSKKVFSFTQSYSFKIETYLNTQAKRATSTGFTLDYGGHSSTGGASSRCVKADGALYSWKYTSEVSGDSAMYCRPCIMVQYT